MRSLFSFASNNPFESIVIYGVEKITATILLIFIYLSEKFQASILRFINL